MVLVKCYYTMGKLVITELIQSVLIFQPEIKINIHPQIKARPPIGVIGPRKVQFSIPNKFLVDKR